jgi:hypothetical protein
MKRKTPFLQNQHPVRIYTGAPRSSGGGLNPTQVLKSHPKKSTICSLIDSIFKPTPTALGDHQAIAPQPSVQKLFQSINNPITVGTVALQIMLANPNRTSFTVTNVGTTTIYVGYGRVPSINSFEQALQACTVANNGSGGVLIDEEFLGTIFVISNAIGGAVALIEEP